MSKSYLLRKVLVAFLAFGLVMSALFAALFAVQETYATDEDTVTVSGVSVVWGDEADDIYLQLNGADFSTVFNQVSNSNFGYFMPCISINGVLLSERSGSVLYAVKGYYGEATRYRIQVSALEDYSLKGDGTDIVVIEAGCKIPKTETDRDKDTAESVGVDYYVVSKTATFIAPANAAGTGTEMFISAEYVKVDGISVEWDGNGGGNDLVTLSLEGASFESNTDSNDHRHEIESHIFVNGTQISNVAWAIEGRYTNPKHYCFYLPQGILKQDGSDVIEVRSGCRIPVNNGESYYMVTETISYVSSGSSVSGKTETFTKRFVWELDAEYDASREVFVNTEAEQGVLGGHDSLSVSIGNLPQEHPEWNLPLTGYSAQTSGLLSVSHFAEFRFANVIDLVEVGAKSADITFLYNGAALFYIFPLDVTELTYENAVQSFRTTSGSQKLTVSAETLARDGSFGGFIVQLIDGSGAQFFLDGITLSTDVYMPDDVEEVVEFEWKLQEYDINSEIVKPAGKGQLGDFRTGGMTIGSGHEAFGIKGGDLFTPASIGRGDYFVIEFAVPIPASLAKSIVIEYLYNGDALFYIYPLDTTELMYKNAVQSFRTTSGSQKLTVSAEALAQDGSFGGFIVQLIDGLGAQFFLDGITLSSDVYTPDDVEEVVEFEWKINEKFDIDSSVIKQNGNDTMGEYSVKGLTISIGHDDWGLTGDGFAYTDVLERGNCFVVEFVSPIELSGVNSFSIEVMHNASACFYVYPLGTTGLTYKNAVQSFRTTNGLNPVELSATELFENGVCNGFIVQLMTDTGVQFFIDSITLSSEMVEAEVEDLTEPEYTVSPVSITEVSYTYRYEGREVDLLLITFDEKIFNHSLDSSLWNERIGVDDFAEFLLVNGVSIAESGIGDYAIRDMWTRHDRLGIFIKSGAMGCMNNDAFDAITFAKGFAIRGSSGDYTMYTTQRAAVFYTNRALEEGAQVMMSQESNPQVDQSLTPLSISLDVSGDIASLAITFDKTVRMEGTDFTDNIFRYIFVNKKSLAEWGGVTVSFEGATMNFTFATTLAADDAVTVMVEKGLNIQTNPAEPLSEKTVQQTLNFVRRENEEYFFAEEGALYVYWATSPETLAAQEEGGEDFITFELRLSVQNAPVANFNSSVLQYILIGEKPLSEILEEDKGGSSVSLSAFTLNITIPASYIADGLVVTAQKGFTTPAGGVLADDESFVYDETFEEFNGEVHREEIEDILTPTDINSILTAKDGVAPGTNQLFIEFTTPCSVKYLPFAQADADTIFSSYGSVGVSMTALYTYQLNRYGIRESLLDYLLIDGKTLREWAVEDGGADASRYIDVYYQGTNFGIYYLQLVLSKDSSAVMDWSEAHTITFKAGFITPAFGVFTEDVQWVWNPETQTWSSDESANTTVDPNAELKTEDGETVITFESGGCSGMAAGAGSLVAAVLAAGTAVLLCKRRSVAGKRGVRR